jgi:hypothetical protein
MFNVTIEADSIESLREKILNFAKILLTPQTGQTSGISNIMLQSDIKDPQPATSASSENVTQIDKKSKTPKRAKVVLTPQKENQVALVSQPEIAPERGVEYTREQALAALQNLNVLKGLPEAREVLSQFGCARISDVKPDQYGAFIAACKAKTEA